MMRTVPALPNHAGAHGGRARPARLAAAGQACVAVVFALLSGCGGGTDGTGRVGGDQAVTSSGVMTRGSVILNDTRFDAGSARVTDDRSRTADQLETGMVIRLRGSSNDAGTGRADLIDVENELRAPIASIDRAASPRRFVAAGALVIVESTTMYANVAGFDALAPGMRVEVHGLRDADGWVRATRIEAVGAVGADEMRGRITAVDSGARRIVLGGNLTVDYGGATFAPAGATDASLAIGATVEVRGRAGPAGSFSATEVDIEALEDAVYGGAASEKQEVEGYVTAFVAHPGEFLVNGRLVRTTESTKFPGGSAQDLGDNVRVEVDGRIDAQGVLVATHVKYKRTRVTLQGLATAVNVAARTVALLGQTVQTNDITRFSGGPRLDLADIVAGLHCVDVSGYADGAQIVAERVRRQPNCTLDVVQAPVTSKDTATFTLGFFGSLNAAMLPGTQFRNGSEALTREAFFALVTPESAAAPGTLVRVEGTFAGGAFAVATARLEGNDPGDDDDDDD